MATKRVALRAEEVDAYGRWRKRLCYLQRAGAVKGIKRRTHRRERHEGKSEIQAQREDR